MLNGYLASTQALLQLPPAPSTLYPASLLTNFINGARGQLAGESNSIRFEATIQTVAGQQVYPFKSLSTGTSATNGIAGVIHVRTVWVQLGTGRQWLRPRPFEWFSLYELNNVVPQQALPQVWAQFGQGVNGTIYLSPVPDITYTLFLDCVCFPIPLVDDTTVEAIPYLWTDAVPFFAAFLALLSAQSAQRQGDANRMFQRYEEFTNRARRFATPDVLQGQYAQQPNVTRPNQLAMRSTGQAGA